MFRDWWARAGAIWSRTRRRRPTFLVIGDINPAVLRPNSDVNGNARKASEPQDKGQPIESWPKMISSGALAGSHSTFSKICSMRNRHERFTEARSAALDTH
jgi:hypothetical protein